MRDSILSIALTGALVLGASPVLADWTLDPERSAVTYVTIKSKDIPENNHFKEMRGQIDGPLAAGADRAGRAIETALVRAARTGDAGFRPAPGDFFTFEKVTKKKTRNCVSGDFLAGSKVLTAYRYCGACSS